MVRFAPKSTEIGFLVKVVLGKFAINEKVKKGSPKNRSLTEFPHFML